MHSIRLISSCLLLAASSWVVFPADAVHALAGHDDTPEVHCESGPTGLSSQHHHCDVLLLFVSAFYHPCDAGDLCPVFFRCRMSAELTSRWNGMAVPMAGSRGPPDFS